MCLDSTRRWTSSAPYLARCWCSGLLPHGGSYHQAFALLLGQAVINLSLNDLDERGAEIWWAEGYRTIGPKQTRKELLAVRGFT